jgi:hypothetical protein
VVGQPTAFPHLRGSPEEAPVAHFATAQNGAGGRRRAPQWLAVLALEAEWENELKSEMA